MVYCYFWPWKFFDYFYLGAASAFKSNLYSHISCAVSFSLSQVCLPKGREEYDLVFGRVWLDSLHATEKISILYPSFSFLFITLGYFSLLVLYFRQYRVYCVLQHSVQFLYFGETRYERMRHSFCFSWREKSFIWKRRARKQ